MRQEQFELQITQYLDGTLPAAERAALEQHLAQDAEARRMLEEHRKLDALLAAMPAVPPIRWEALAERISAAVAQEEAPIRNYSIAFVRQVRRVALAACLLIAAGTGWWLYDSRTPAPPSVAHVLGPQAEPSHGPAVAEIRIGPSPLAARWEESIYGQAVISRPSQVVIASGSLAAHDIDQPY